LVSVNAPAVTSVTAIRVARKQPIGTVVTVEGVVTTPSGAFNSGVSDRGFAVQDRTGGLFVSLQYDLQLRPGQKVRATGAIGQSNGLLTLVPTHPDEVTVLPGKGEVEPRKVRTAKIGEATEGQLVQVVGRITQAPENELPYGYKLYVDDGSGALVVFVNVETNIDAMAFSAGQQVRVVGFSSQYEDHYEIDPRFPRDIRLAR
jgi:DNA/RNA endonuclease YhcR with UshA esterase domain